MDDVEKLKSGVQKAVHQLVKDEIFRLVLIVHDAKIFGNEIVFLTSNIGLSIRYIKDRDDHDLRCQIKWSVAQENLFPMGKSSILLSYDLKEIAHKLSEEQYSFIVSPEGWIDLNDILAAIGIEGNSQFKDFLEMIEYTSKVIINNLGLIRAAFNDNNRHNTIRIIKEMRAKRRKTFLDSQNQIADDSSFGRWVELNNN